MATTTNFGWETPDDTDLVKDGALAMRTLGNSIDTSFVDLKGGTTGQILSKASNTDLDYTWINNDTGDITGITTGATSGLTGGVTSGTADLKLNTTAKGGLLVGTGSGTVSELAVGSNAQYLTADSTTATGLKWVTPGTTLVGCSVYASAAQSISNATATILNFNTEEFDTNGFHDNATNNSRITIPSGKGGYYLVTATCNWTANATGGRSLYLYKNGSLDIYAQEIPTSSGTYATINVFSFIRNLVAGDYLELAGYQNSGGSLNARVGLDTGRFQVQYLGA